MKGTGRLYDSNDQVGQFETGLSDCDSVAVVLWLADWLMGYTRYALVARELAAIT